MKAVRMNTIVTLGGRYRQLYDAGYKPEDAARIAKKELGLPPDFIQDDYMLICDGQKAEDYGCDGYAKNSYDYTAPQEGRYCACGNEITDLET
jgi:hypothetical protein